ncbi:MAG: DMT family transporter [Candidatus Puniceispirillales bacterium]|jgi:drug/metabolite transporter (DMT)-like permease|nr:DMT family transporter [Alphaproteobacteria bacterium]MBL6850832.1 DMT family transporter [Alphaproteobacteria bacterium]MDA0915743.1 DMT family transporter [Pseudomonadota bacterium]
MTNKSIDGIAALFLIIFSVLLGLNQVLVKLVNEGMHPIFQVALRSTLAIFPILIYCYIRKKKIDFFDGSFLPGLIAGVLFAIEFILLFTALDYSTVTRVSLIFYTMPVWLTVAAHFLIKNDTLTLNKFIGLIIALIGLIFAIYQPVTNYNIQQFYGDLFSLLASFCWAIIAIMLKTTRLTRSSPETQLLYQLIVSGIILLPISLMLEDFIRDINNQIILIFSFQVIVIMCLGFIGWLWIMSKYSASSTSSFAFLTPISGVLFGWLMMDDVINEQIFISLFLTCLGIYIINKKSG